MLSKPERQIVDRAWDVVWSGGITNPILVSDLLGSILMLRSSDAPADWTTLRNAALADLSEEVALTISRVRRAHGIDPGGEIEDISFWRSSGVLGRAMDVLEPLFQPELGVPPTDLLGDVYEHILSRLSTAGHFGQFRTPRHIVEFMVEVLAPESGDLVVDPACGSGGFLIAAAKYRAGRGLSGRYSGSEVDRTIARIAEANLVLHHMAAGEVKVGDGLLLESAQADIVLANPPFAGMVSNDIAGSFAVATKKTELLFVQAIERLLKPGGRAAVIVPTGVVTGTGQAPRAVRQILVDENRLTHVVELPRGVFWPYTDVKTAILVWSNAVASESVRMLRIETDGFTLDQRRGPTEANDLPAALEVIAGGDADVPWVDVSADEIRASGYNLNPSRYLTTAKGGSEHARPDLSTAVRSFGQALPRLHELHVQVTSVEGQLRDVATERLTLGDLVTPVRRAVKPADVQADRLCVLLEHITSGTGEVSGVSAAEADVRSGKFAFEAGDVLYGKLRPALRKCAVAPAPGICSTDIVPLRPKLSNTSYLVAAILRSQEFTIEVARLVAGANLPRVKVEELLTLPVSWPINGEVVEMETVARIAHRLRTETAELFGRVGEVERALVAASQQSC